MASWAASGIQIGVSSPARCSLASITASRRSVFTRSPALIGISDAPPRRNHARNQSAAGAAHTARTGLVTKAQPPPGFAQPRRQLDQKLGTVLKHPDLADLAAAATLGKRDTNRRFVHIQPDIGDIIHQARLPCMRLCTGHPAQPSTFCMSRGGPPITQRTSGLV